MTTDNPHDAETQTERVPFGAAQDAWLESQFAMFADDMTAWAELTYPLAAETAALIDNQAEIEGRENGEAE